MEDFLYLNPEFLIILKEILPAWKKNRLKNSPKKATLQYIGMMDSGSVWIHTKIWKN